MAQINQIVTRISAAGTNTTVLTSADALVQQIAVGIEDIGSSGTLKLTNGEGTPKVLLPAITLALPTTLKDLEDSIIKFPKPLSFKGGVKAVTTGGPKLTIWLDMPGYDG